MRMYAGFFFITIDEFRMGEFVCYVLYTFLSVE